MTDTWLPFLGIGTEDQGYMGILLGKFIKPPITNFTRYKDDLVSDFGQEFVGKLRDTHYLKRLARFGNMECAIISHSVGDGIWKDNLKYSLFREIRILNDYIDNKFDKLSIQINEDSEFNTSQPEEVNKWLLENDANLDSKKFPKNLEGFRFSFNEIDENNITSKTEDDSSNISINSEENKIPHRNAISIKESVEYENFIFFGEENNRKTTNEEVENRY